MAKKSKKDKKKARNDKKRKQDMQKKRMILAEFPISEHGEVIFNQNVRSKEAGLRKVEKEFGPLEHITVAEMDGVRTADDRRFMIFLGEKEIDMLAHWMTDEVIDGDGE